MFIHACSEIFDLEFFVFLIIPDFECQRLVLLVKSQAGEEQGM